MLVLHENDKCRDGVSLQHQHQHLQQHTHHMMWSCLAAAPASSAYPQQQHWTTHLISSQQPNYNYTGLQASDIAVVEVLGGSTRVPAVFKLIETAFGIPPSRTLNAKEVVSRGAALQCAMISPLIKVCVYVAHTSHTTRITHVITTQNNTKTQTTRCVILTCRTRCRTRCSCTTRTRRGSP